MKHVIVSLAVWRPVPAEKKCWEGRTILAAIGADLELPDDAKVEANPPATAKELIVKQNRRRED